MILRSTFAARRTRASPDVPAARPVAEAIWAIAPVIVLIVVMLATWRAAHEQPGERPRRAIEAALASVSRS